MKRIWTPLILMALVGFVGCAQPVDEAGSSSDSGEAAETPAGGETGEQETEEAEGEASWKPKSESTVKYVKANASWATLRAKFVYGGTAPEPATIDGSRDPFCAKIDIESDALVVGEDGGIKNLAIYMDRRSRVRDVHPDLKDPADKTVELDNRNCMFSPHVMFLRPGQTIKVLNSDETGHNAKFNFFNNTEVNFLVPVGGSKSVTLTSDEPAPIPVECSIHPWMKAFVIVQEHPYVGISDDSGMLEIEKLPVGEVTFRVWHESQDGSIDEAVVDGEKQSWRRGRMKVELKPGVNDLGTIVIDGSKFQP